MVPKTQQYQDVSSRNPDENSHPHKPELSLHLHPLIRDLYSVVIVRHRYNVNRLTGGEE